MGYSLYNDQTRTIRAQVSGYTTKSVTELFVQSKVHESMRPNGLLKRECFDSEAHPNSYPVILGLDVTGSMGKIPHNLVQTGLPTIMTSLQKKNLGDAAVCFVAIGDHLSDTGPLQVGQFECGDEELDKCLLNTWLEGNGGGNNGESYFLAWLFASRHTHTHAWEKRNQKGCVITIGDEPCHASIDAGNFTRIMGMGAEGKISADQLLEEAKEKYNVYHLYLETGHGCFPEWRNRLGENAIRVSDYTDIPKVIADIVAQNYTVKETPIVHTEEVL